MPGEDVTYPPLDVLKPVAENLWIVDSGPQEAMGLSLPVRMTVIRMGNGDVWLHSPTRYNAELRREIETLGPIRHLVAPNIAHWTHLKEWQGGCPAAKTSAAPNLRQRPQVRKAGIRLDRDLMDRQFVETLVHSGIPKATAERIIDDVRPTDVRKKA